jgi:hypothetical protein
LKRRRRDSNPRYLVQRYYGAMIPRLFAGVQKLLQVGVFSLLSHCGCSRLFVWVGVSVGVRTDWRLRGFAFSWLSGDGGKRAGISPNSHYCPLLLFTQLPTSLVFPETPASLGPLGIGPGPSDLPLLDRGAAVSYVTWAAGPGMRASFFASLRPRIRPENGLLFGLFLALLRSYRLSTSTPGPGLCGFPTMEILRSWAVWTV